MVLLETIIESGDLLSKVIDSRSYIDGIWTTFSEDIQEDVLTV